MNQRTKNLLDPLKPKPRQRQARHAENTMPAPPARPACADCGRYLPRDQAQRHECVARPLPLGMDPGEAPALVPSLRKPRRGKA